MRRVTIVTGARGGYGYIRPVIREVDACSDMQYDLIATNLYLLSDFGYSLGELERDGVQVTDKIYITIGASSLSERQVLLQHE